MRLTASRIFSIATVIVLLVVIGFMLLQGRRDLALSERVAASRNDARTQSQLSPEGLEELSLTFIDPATGVIPPGIRSRELEFARTLPKRAPALSKSSNASLFNWASAGPNNHAGRTRGLVVDVNDPNNIIAGGVSSGVWKSIDGGASWALKTAPGESFAVTTIAQDTRAGQTNTWYFAGGEFRGGTTSSDRGFRAPFMGAGIFKSTDNGDTWQLLPSTKDPDPTIFNAAFDYVHRLVISPTTGTVFVANNASGIAEHAWSDVAVGPDGVVVATLSQQTQGATQQTNPPGVYKSNDDGLTWTRITPATFPSTHHRSLLAVASSNPDLVYVLTFTGQTLSDGREDMRFHKINLATGAAEDRSANLPRYSGTPAIGAAIHAWFNFCMVLAVKPDDGIIYALSAKTTPGAQTPDVQWILGGDGSYCYLGERFVYSSLNLGDVFRHSYTSANRTGVGSARFIGVPPRNSTQGRRFTHHYAIDPAEERVMLFPVGNVIYRNTNIEATNPTNTWTALAQIAAPSGYFVTAMAMAQQNPAHVLYFGASTFNTVPRIYRWENAHTATSGLQEISVRNQAVNIFVHNIAVNPLNANEILVVFSNYNIVGLYHSLDGGQTYTAIEGNLTGTSANPGPSLRAASILPLTNLGDSRTAYFVATSAGLFSTTALNGANTIWEQEANDLIGSAVTEHIAARISDGRVAVATLGRGMLVGDYNTPTSVEDKPPTALPTSFRLQQNYPNPFNPDTRIAFELPTASRVTVTIFEVNGANLKSKLAVIARKNVQAVFVYRLERVKPFIFINTVHWRTPTAMPADSLLIQLGLPNLHNVLKNKRGMILV